MPLITHLTIDHSTAGRASQVMADHETPSDIPNDINKIPTIAIINQTTDISTTHKEIFEHCIRLVSSNL